MQQKKKALQARLSRSQTQSTEKESKPEIVPAQKRKNPFLKNSNENAKRPKIEPELPPHNEDTVFQLIQQTEEPKPPPPKRQFDIFNNYEEQEETEVEEQKFNPHLAIDWSIKSRLRIFCKESLPETSLKTSQEASGLTSFVRCIDPSDSSTGLDISPSARFYQSTLYWQHPHLPWMTLFPRNSKSNNGPIAGEMERASLLKDWTESFRGLFQLVRARQCPYFYVCANTFTVLFRAAGICGRVETHALLSPSTRGMRNALRQEEVEFTQPLKKEVSLNRSGEGNSSFSNPSDDGTQESTTDLPEEDDDLEDDKWLESLGVDAKEIKKINAINSRLLLNKESAEDASDNSLVLIEGIECQAFFNFLLNAKSTIATVGRLAGVPPTLLAPVAFPGATMRSLQTRSTKVRMDGTDYSSVELKGVILPHVLQYQCNLLAEMRDSFSATMAVNTNTLAFCKASKIIAEEVAKENKTSDQVFGKENLSDCGLQSKILDSMCRVGTDAVDIIERMCYCKEQGGYSWS